MGFFTSREKAEKFASKSQKALLRKKKKPLTSLIQPPHLATKFNQEKKMLVIDFPAVTLGYYGEEKLSQVHIISLNQVIHKGHEKSRGGSRDSFYYLAEGLDVDNQK